jgi:hypothetical protein
MKKQVIQQALSLGLSLLPLVVSAKTREQVYLESYRGQSGIPIPIAVERPIVSTEYIGTQVDLRFVVDERGRARDIVAATPAEPEVVEKLVDAVSRWEFMPLRDLAGNPRSSRVKLPMRIAKPERR